MKYELFFSSHNFIAANPAVSSFACSLPTWAIDDEDKDRFRALAPKDFVIVFSHRAKEVLTVQEFEAIVAHELGHLEEGDLSEENMRKGIRYVDETEIRADAHAVAKCGARTMYTALRKVAKLSVAATVLQDNLSTVETVAELRAVARKIAPRLAALRAAM